MKRCPILINSLMAGILPDSGLGAGDLMKLLRSFNEECIQVVKA